MINNTLKELKFQNYKRKLSKKSIILSLTTERESLKCSY